MPVDRANTPVSPKFFTSFVVIIPRLIKRAFQILFCNKIELISLIVIGIVNILNKIFVF